MTEVRFTQRGHKLLRDLPSEIQDRVEEDLREARENPEREVDSLTGWDYHDVRTGDY